MNVFFIILDGTDLRYALVPLYRLLEVYPNFRKWDGVIVSAQDGEYDDDIMDIFEQMGLEGELPKSQQMFRRFLHHKPPYSDIGMVIRIGWVE